MVLRSVQLGQSGFLAVMYMYIYPSGLAGHLEVCVGRYPTYLLSQKCLSVMSDPIITDMYVTTSVKVAGALPPPHAGLKGVAAV